MEYHWQRFFLENPIKGYLSSTDSFQYNTLFVVVGFHVVLSSDVHCGILLNSGHGN